MSSSSLFYRHRDKNAIVGATFAHNRGMAESLASVYDGWEGYNRSLMNAVEPLTEQQLAFRLHPEMQPVGELALHIADGRIVWFERLHAPFTEELRAKMDTRATKPSTGPELAAWLGETYRIVDALLTKWSVADLPETYEQAYQGKVYAVSRQWVIFRMLAHDIHHGGQLSELLGAQGIFPQELTWLGGHLTEPPVIR